MADHDTNGQAWLVPPSAYLATRPPEFACPAKPLSLYVAMRDGCRLAVDVYLPQQSGGPEPASKLPAVLILTPYYRRFALKSGAPAGTETSPNAAKYRDFFVPRGYALVVVDVRGTGASFGTRDSFRSPAEREDYARDRRVDRRAALVERRHRLDRHLLSRRRRPVLGQHRPSRREGGRAALCGLEHLCRSFLSGRRAAEPARGELRPAHDRARSRSTRPPRELCLFPRPELRRAATGRRGCRRRAVARGRGRASRQLPHAGLHHRVPLHRRPPALRSELRSAFLQPLQLCRMPFART